MSDGKNSLREQFPEASVSALWQAVEHLAGKQLACAKPWDGIVDCPTRYRGEPCRRRWCTPCLVRDGLRHSHEYQEQLRLFRPASMKTDDPKLTPRERLLCAAGAVSGAWKAGEGDAIREANSAFYQALDAYEYGVAEPWEELARQLTTAPRSVLGGELREKLRSFFLESNRQLTDWREWAAKLLGNVGFPLKVREAPEVREVLGRWVRETSERCATLERRARS